MRRARVVILTLFAGMLASGAWNSAVAQGDITGGWIVTGWENAQGVNPDAQRGLFMFTASGQYSIMFVPGSEARASTSEGGATDAEKIGAYDSFVANSGRYAVEGDQVTMEAYMAKSPNYMAAWEDNGVTATFRVDGDEMTISWPEGALLGGGTVTLRRPGAG